MGCSSCGGNKKHIAGIKQSMSIPPSPINNSKISNNPIKNLNRAISEQPEKIKWFRDGLSGIIKCFSNITKYSDEDIKKNRDVCRQCEYSSKNTNNELDIKSQCMRPNPEKNNAPCACFIVCKTQVGSCDKWTHVQLTINKKEQILRDEGDIVNI